MRITWDNYGNGALSSEKYINKAGHQAVQIRVSMFCRELSPDAWEMRGTERDTLISVPDSHLLKPWGLHTPGLDPCSQHSAVRLRTTRPPLLLLPITRADRAPRMSLP